MRDDLVQGDYVGPTLVEATPKARVSNEDLRTVRCGRRGVRRDHVTLLGFSQDESATVFRANGCYRDQAPVSGHAHLVHDDEIAFCQTIMHEVLTRHQQLQSP
jgi:hypothetical protein